MTPEEAKAAAEVMLAYAEGKKIELRPNGVVAWFLTENPDWRWSDYEYRIAIEKPSINWDHVAPHINAIWADEQQWLACKHPPDARGSYINADVFAEHLFASFNPGNCDWKESLIIRPGYEEE